jgi:hypothetical protein
MTKGRKLFKLSVNGERVACPRSICHSSFVKRQGLFFGTGDVTDH